jgi:phosphoribosyl 1,2-cyclic phosphodiesterase
MIETKLLQAIRMSRQYPLENDDAVKAFIRTRLPFAVRGTYGGNTSCVEVRGSGEYVLCDAGTGLRDFGQAYMKAKTAGQADLPKVFHLFISHPHWDHIQGFPFFTPAFIPGHEIHIYGHHPELEKAFVNQQEAPCFPVPLKAMRANISFHVMEAGRTYDIAGMNVTGIRQNHPGDSYGYCFTAAGKKIVYSTDAEHKQDAEDSRYEFIRFFQQADLLIFDAQYSLLDAMDAKENWGHSSNLVGVELAVRAGVKRLCLFHGEHSYDDEALDRFLDDTRKYLKIFDDASSLEIHMAYDGMALAV